MKAVNAIDLITETTEREGHHPDLHVISFTNLEVAIYTHEIWGLTKHGIVLAAKIDSALSERS